MKTTYTPKAVGPDISDRLDYLEAMTTVYFPNNIWHGYLFGMKAAGMI